TLRPHHHADGGNRSLCARYEDAATGAQAYGQRRRDVLSRPVLLGGASVAVLSSGDDGAGWLHRCRLAGRYANHRTISARPRDDRFCKARRSGCWRRGAATFLSRLVAHHRAFAALVGGTDQALVGDLDD